MYSGNIEMRNLLAQAELPQGTNWHYTYSIQEPQHVGGANWEVPVNVAFTTSVTVEEFSYSVEFDGLEMLTIDVDRRQVTSEELISYTMR
jgi:hypothetical protein